MSEKMGEWVEGEGMKFPSFFFIFFHLPFFSCMFHYLNTWNMVPHHYNHFKGK